MKLIEEQIKLQGVRKIFENVHAVKAILALFELFPAKFCLNFLTLILSASPNSYDAFGSHIFSIMRAYGVRLIANEEVRNYGKIVCIKNIFGNGWWENAYLSTYPPGSAPSHKLQKPLKESGMFPVAYARGGFGGQNYHDLIDDYHQSRSSRPPNPPIGGGPTAKRGPKLS